MTRTWLLALLGVTLLAWAGEGAAQDAKSRVVEIDGMKGTVPADWIIEKPANRLRYLQFKLPKAKDDAVDGELIVNKGIGGSPEANIKRWKEQFVPPTGKTLDDVSKVTEMKIGKNKAWYLDVSGTYKFKDAPFDPKAKEELRPNQRMLGIHYEGSDDPYHFKLVGPAKTVEQHKKGFDDWINSLK